MWWATKKENVEARPKFPVLPGGQLRPEGLAIVLEQDDPRVGAKRADRVEVPGEPEGVRDEQRLEARGPDPLRERAGGHVQRGRFAVDRNGDQPHLQDRHDVRRPGEGGEPHLLALPERPQVAKPLDQRQVRAPAAVEQDRLGPPLAFREGLFEFDAPLPHAQLAGLEDELGEGLPGLVLIEKRVLHQRNHGLRVPFFRSRYSATVFAIPSSRPIRDRNPSPVILRDVEALPRHPVRLRGVPEEFPPETGGARDHRGKVPDGNVEPAADVDDFRGIRVLHEKQDGVGEIVHVQELPPRHAGAPYGDLALPVVDRIDEFPDQRRQDVGAPRVERIVGAVEVARDRADPHQAVLPPVTFHHLHPGELRDGVPFVRRLQLPGQRCSSRIGWGHSRG